jgi:hypothetical protein
LKFFENHNQSKIIPRNIKMIATKYALLSILSYFILIFTIGLDRLSRSYSLTYTSIYEPSTGLSTISSHYSSSSPFQPRHLKDSEVTNSEFTSYSPKFHIDDSSKLSSTSSLSCKPNNFGYSVQAGKFVFPDFSYPACSTLAAKNLPELHLDSLSNTFSMSCKDGEPFYVLEPVAQKGRLFQYDEISDLFEVKAYKGPVKVTSEEFVLGSCDGKTFTAAQHIFRHSQEVLEKDEGEDVKFESET